MHSQNLVREAILPQLPHSTRGGSVAISSTEKSIGSEMNYSGIVTTYAKDSNGKISSFVIDMDSAGIETKEIRNKIGLLSVINSEITFDSCRIPKGNLIGSEGIGLILHTVPLLMDA